MVWVFALFLISLLMLPGSARAITLNGDSRTYFLAGENTDNNEMLPLYEYLDLQVSNLKTETLSFHFGGWAKYDFTGESFGKQYDNDLQYAYLSFNSTVNNTVVNLGRVMVFEGVAAERVDGLYAKTDLKGGFGVSAFGGSPVETALDDQGGDLIYGGRISHQIPDLYVVGISYLKEKNGSSDFREEEGIDLWVHPFNKTELIGKSSYNSLTDGWMEHTYSLALGPFADLRINPEVSWVNYKNYFTGVTSAAFSFQPGVLNPEEKVLILGGDVAYTLSDGIIISADYRNYDYDISGSANYFGGKFAYSAPEWNAGGSFHRMSGDTDRLKYNEYRVYGLKKFGKADVVADLLDVAYDSEINGVDNAYSVILGGGYNLSESMKLAADLDYSHNPDFDEDVRVLLKFFYRFGTASGI
jgi:hypothetical protein